LNKDKNLMKRTVIDTEDNSKTLLINNTEVTYHSRHGAITESTHIFIENGVAAIKHKPRLTVFEMGFGTGLNAILAYEFAKTHGIKIQYHTIEKYPITNAEVAAFYETIVQYNPNLLPIYKQLHRLEWDTNNIIDDYFEVKKIESDMLDFHIDNNYYDIIFFDAFGPKFQPELWQPDQLKKCYNALKSEGFLITYCAQGQFKRDLKSVLFSVENLPGPPGKREITRAKKA
jgi:tRNA U34 5-methylaminomethyl-2-thiouridine-forming methyltransferase MnmC